MLLHAVIAELSELPSSLFPCLSLFSLGACGSWAWAGRDDFLYRILFRHFLWAHCQGCGRGLLVPVAFQCIGVLGVLFMRGTGVWLESIKSYGVPHYSYCFHTLSNV